MPIIHLVRHARPAAQWDEDPDPGLDVTGAAQAQAVADELAHRFSPLPVYASPLRRCRETAKPLAKRWDRPAATLQAVAEIPSPPLDLHARKAWLMQAMPGTWRQLQDSAPAGAPDYPAWRQAVLDALVGLPEDSVVFSHFIAINVAVTAALGLDRVVCFMPDHASITCVETKPDGGLRLLESGREARTSILTG